MQMNRIIPLRFALVAVLAAGRLLAPEYAHAAGAFAVDDAEAANPGECRVESWASFGANHDFIGAVAPTCGLKFVVPFEVGAQYQRARADSQWGTSGTLKAKANLIPLANNAFGVGIAGGGNWNLITGASTGGFLYIPVTFQVRDNFKININGGWAYDTTTKINYATWGAGFEWSLVKLVKLPLTLIGEVYGQDGRLAAVEPGDAPSNNSVREPRTQLGLRYTPKENIDFDVIWGRNITGENSNWLTLGVNLRF
jgi:hypothetical protein